MFYKIISVSKVNISEQKIFSIFDSLYVCEQTFSKMYILVLDQGMKMYTIKYEFKCQI